MEITTMASKHIEQIAKLEQVCFSMPWSRNASTSELTHPRSLWIVAVDGETVIGYVGSQSVLGEADMMNIAVDPNYRRQGVAQKLVDNLILRLRTDGVRCLTLEVRASNIAAISLYEKNGFIQVGRRPNYYTNPKEDALILRKEWEV